MTKINEHTDHNNQDKNLEQLIGLADPFPKMPENLKARIRTRLIEMGQESEKKNFFFRRWAIISPLAAAVVLALFLIFFWPGSTPGTISWADVQKKLELIRSMSAKNYKEIISTKGRQIIKRSKIYIKDPGLFKIEYFTPDADIDAIAPSPDRILIEKLDPGLYEILTLHPRSQKAEWVTEIVRNNNTESTPGSNDINIALENWKWIKQIAADKTNRIGDREINGVPTVGFEFYTSLQDFYFPSDKPVRPAHVQAWVSRDNAVPILIEAEFENTQGEKVRIVSYDIQWNVQLKEDLFDLSIPNGWRINRSKIESTVNTRLAPGITLQVGPEGQNPIVFARDMVKVAYVTQTSNPDMNIPSETRITLELKPETAGRLIEYANAHRDQLIVVDFNGQIKMPAELDTTRPTQLSFDLSLLGLPLAELEEKYLIPLNERKEQ